MDRLTSMEVFVKVVETGSFVAAAEALGISRPMASKHVIGLEDQLGVRLLNRTTRKIAMTEAGQHFFARCQEIFSQIDEAVQEAGQHQAEPQGKLRINAPVSFSRVHLTRAIAGFQRAHPRISIELILNDRLVDIVEDGFDLAIRIGRLRDSSLIARRLAPCRLVVCAAPTYLAEHGEPRTAEDLKDHNCLVYTQFSESDGWRLRRGEETTSVPVTGSFCSNAGAAVVEAAVAGLGIVLEPSFMVGAHVETGALVPLLTDYEPTELGIYAVYPQSRLLARKVRVFIDYLSDHFGPEPYWDAPLREAIASGVR